VGDLFYLYDKFSLFEQGYAPGVERAMRHAATGQPSRMTDKVVLIINGLSDRGFQLARQITTAGGHVAVVDPRVATRPDYARRFRTEIETGGRHCLVLAGQTPGPEPAGRAALKAILNRFGRLDSFVVYSSDADGPNDLAVAALDHILQGTAIAE
jgi:NAD(P)-dependent dehydrogenase (short-subunit alcohol dehydrogenase family)